MLCYEFPPIGGGSAKVAYGLSKELVREGHKVDLVSMGYRGQPRYESVHGIHVTRVPCIRTRTYLCTIPEAASYMFSAILMTLRLARQRRYDLVHAHFILPDGLLAWQIHKWNRIPYLVTAHGSDVPGYNPHRLKMAHKLLKPIWVTVAQNSSRIVCPSETLQKLVLTQDKDIKVKVIPNGIDTGRFTPNREKTNRILTVSRMLKRKGIQFFLEAIEQFRSDWEVHIVGDGPYLPKLREMSMGMKRNIKFWGWLDNESPKFKELFETSSVFVFPSEAENFPIVLLEAMAAGMAIITTRGTGCAEVVGEAAVLVPPRDPSAIRKTLSLMLQYPERRRAIGWAARKRLEENFSWAAVCKSYISLYENTLIETKAKPFPKR